MHAHSKHLVVGHLEYISREIFKRFHKEITDSVGGRNGIYALYADGKLYYVGLARDLKGRLKRHLNDRHKDSWDHFSVYLTNGEGHMRELETLMLRIIKPTGNRVSGKLKGSTDHKGELERRLWLEQERIIGGMLGKEAKPAKPKRSVLRKTGSLRGHGANGAIFLRALYKGKEYRATLSQDGTVRIGDKRYTSLSAAGMSITKRATNGRRFWRVRNAEKEWVGIGHFHS
ncbi:MAG: DUF2924 domain-containing protein [Flavobacteriales bacterium]|nr:DUF2924 domain-containing protein [Flavobacteriales bacterium]